MLRRHVLCVARAGHYGVACVLHRYTRCPPLLCVCCTSARRTFLNLWARSSTTDSHKKDEDDHKHANEQKSGGFGLGSMFLPRGMDMQKLKEIQEALSKQTPEQQKALFEEVMSLQRNTDKSVGMAERMRRVASTIEDFTQKQKAQQSHTSPSHSSSSSSSSSKNHNRNILTAFATASLKPAVDRSSSPPAVHGKRDGASNTNTNTNNTSTEKTTAVASAGSSRAVLHRVPPTLDELKQINLGPEIEALFAELRTLRAKKNSYRSKLVTAEAALEQVTPELTRLRATEADLRARLRKAEHDVLLLNSENLELSEKATKAKELAQSVKVMQAELREAQRRAAAGTALDSPAYAQLKQQLQSREAATRSLQRRLDRMRQRDPLLQFSLACSDVSRLCEAPEGASSGAAASSPDGSLDTTLRHNHPVLNNRSNNSNSPSSSDDSSSSNHHHSVSIHGSMRESAEETFGQLRSAYARAQEAAWRNVAQEGGAAAKAYLAVVRQLLASRVRHAHYDASITLSVPLTPEVLTRVRDWFAPLRMEVWEVDELDSTDSSSNKNNNGSGDTHVGSHNRAAALGSASTRLFLCAAADAVATAGGGGQRGFCGPYGYALAHALAQRMKDPQTTSSRSHTSASARLPQPHAPFVLTAVAPFVSSRLIHHSERCQIRYDTCRASGPGGQAVNVSETQVHARLSIDGVWAYSAEAQDSRRALSNREAARERLCTKRRQQYNESLARECALEEVTRQLVTAVREAGGLTMSEEAKRLVVDAVEAGEVPAAEAALVSCLQYISEEAARDEN